VRSEDHAHVSGRQIEKGLRPSLTEGYEHGQWILVDYFDFIVHVFSPSTREFYELERLWGDAKRIEMKWTESPEDE